jgi:hydroxymethylglutaryl-CoA reductase (NADPH)
MSLAQCTNRRERLSYLQNKTGNVLSSVDAAFIDDETAPHCENMIGAVAIPVGVAGPIKIQKSRVKSQELEGQNGKEHDTGGEYYVPLATTEGALVASVNRGSKVSREVGGFSVHINKKGATRGPVFKTARLSQSHQLVSFVQSNQKELKEAAEASSAHLHLLEITPKVVGSYVFLRCAYDTDKAMGMNMVTIASQQIADYIEQHTDARCLAVAGNYDLDKKPAWLNMIEGRGFEVWAETHIKPDVVDRLLKTSAERLYDVWLGKCMVGSAVSGSLGYNAHFANVIAAFYAATGQDIAHTVEGSIGMTTCSITQSGDLTVSIYLPSVMLGVIGGGTKLKTQTEARSLTGADTSEQLAEVVGAAVLAGELSLLASLAEQSLARSHKTLGR